MKIFISHSSVNKEYGDVLVDLLRAIEIPQSQIIYTSNPAYGIPLSQNIFNWLKNQITNKPFVIYLLSKEYYYSIACLNEMGAAWVVENKHAIIFIPGFEINSKEFQNGAIDPREMGFYPDNQERLLSFIQLLEENFTISSNRILVQQAVEKFIKAVKEINKQPPFIRTVAEGHIDTILQPMETQGKPSSTLVEIIPRIVTSPQNVLKKQKFVDLYEKFIDDVTSGKLNTSELLLLNYIVETGNIKLCSGWQERAQISKIELWEEVHEMNNRLSISYAALVEKFSVRGYTEV